ncbi:MAG: hypothetical protein ABW022_11170 [Actinoplanes sp.]
MYSISIKNLVTALPVISWDDVVSHDLNNGILTVQTRGNDYVVKIADGWMVTLP